LLYVVNGGGIVNCAEAKTGEILWTHRLEGAFAATPMLADGKLYVINETGVTTVLQAGKELKVLATNKIDDTFLATPVAADEAIFLRSDSALYCIGPRKK
jgi:outer membrane protein assembly factor BamB